MARSTRFIGCTVAAALLTLALLTGCSASSDSGGADSDRAEVGAVEDADDAGAPEAGLGGGEAGLGGGEAGSVDDADSAGGDSAAENAANLPEGRMIARDADLQIAVDDVDRATAEVRAAAVAADGWIVREEVEPDGDPNTYDGFAVLVLSVPSSALDQTLAALDPVGRVTGSALTSDDVTAQYTDTSARIKTLEASITRLRALMEDASGVEDIVALERELAQREADLDALQAIVKGLEGEVERSSITVTLREVDPLAPVAADDEDRTGFAAGLASGWDAFLGAITFLFTALGALLPFAILAAVIAAPLVWWRRKRTATRQS